MRQPPARPQLRVPVLLMVGLSPPLPVTEQDSCQSDVRKPRGFALAPPPAGRPPGGESFISFSGPQRLPAWVHTLVWLLSKWPKAPVA